MTTIIADSKVKKAIAAFRARLKSEAVDYRISEWGFPNGDRADLPTYTITSGHRSVQVGLPDLWNTRIPHLFRLVKENAPPSPDVEINIPTSLDRSVAGIYVSSGAELQLCHRGIFTSFRGRIPFDTVRQHFEKWLIDVDDFGRVSSVIPVVAIESNSFTRDIVSFVGSVIALKEKHKSGNSDEEPSNNKEWRTGQEFEGTKKRSESAPSSEHQYLHGPICNRLDNCITNAIRSMKSRQCRKNANIDLAIIDRTTEQAEIIFEVKTSSLPSNQIYTAVGQLLYYRHKYGNRATKLCVVLPEEHISTITSDFLRAAEIDLAYDSADGFMMSDGRSILAYIQSLK